MRGGRRERNGPRWNSIKGGDEEREILREEWKMMSRGRERMDTAIRVRKRKGEKISFKEGILVTCVCVQDYIVCKIILLGKSYNYHNYDLFINEFKKRNIYIKFLFVFIVKSESKSFE